MNKTSSARPPWVGASALVTGKSWTAAGRRQEATTWVAPRLDVAKMIDTGKFSYIISLSLMEDFLVVVKFLATKFPFLISCIYIWKKSDIKYSFVYQKHLDEPSRSYVREIWRTRHILMIVSD
jgi:hypothetical protein